MLKKQNRIQKSSEYKIHKTPKLTQNKEQEGLAVACTATAMRGKLGSEFET